MLQPSTTRKWIKEALAQGDTIYVQRSHEEVIFATSTVLLRMPSNASWSYLGLFPGLPDTVGQFAYSGSSSSVRSFNAHLSEKAADMATGATVALQKVPLLCPLDDLSAKSSLASIYCSKHEYIFVNYKYASLSKALPNGSGPHDPVVWFSNGRWYLIVLPLASPPSRVLQSLRPLPRKS